MAAPLRDMKVLHTISHMDSRKGGPPNSALAAVLASARVCNYNVLVYAADSRRPVPYVDEAFDNRVRFRPVLFGKDGAGTQRYGAARGVWAEVHAQARDSDAIHVHALWSWPGIAAISAARRYRVPVILSPHEQLTDFDLSSGTLALPGWARASLARTVLSGVDTVIFSSDLERADSASATRKFRGDTAVILHALPTMTVLETAPTSPDPDRWRLGMIGRLHPKKNIELTLDALAALGPGYDLTLAGSGPPEYEQALKAMARNLGVDSRVTWLGHIEADQKSEFFRACDVVVMPSAYECFGLATAEALVHRRPVVVSPTVGAKEVVLNRGGGEVMGAITGRALVEQIQRITASGDAYARYVSATAEAGSAFSIEAHSEALAAVYEGLTTS